MSREPTQVELERIGRQIEERADAEQRYLRALRSTSSERAAPSKGPVRIVSRRRFLSGAVAAIAAGSTAAVSRSAGAKAPAGAVERPVPSDPTKVQGTPIGADGGYGSRSQFETEVRWRYPTVTAESSWSMTPLEGSLGIVTPSGLHFERHHNGIATIDPARHTLIVHGMVDRPKKFSMADLHRFPSISRMLFLECSGNTLTEWKKPTLKTVQGTHGLTSTSEWTGVPLALILREVGVQPGAKWILAEGADAAEMTRSIPIEKCWDDALLAYGQNGEAIRPEQGYPLRLLLPGWEGNINIKWLRRLQVSDVPFETREETSKYSDLLADGRARQFTFVMEAKSVITYPSGEMTLPGPSFHEITGLAWSARGKITRTEVSTDGGKTWADARLQDPVLPICHTRFRFPWRWDGRPAILQSRATDETGYVQPTIGALVGVRGVNSVYHMNGIQSWAVAENGSVTNVHHF